MLANPTPHAIAVHEAGHAVMYWLLTRRASTLELFEPGHGPTAEIVGLCRYDRRRLRRCGPEAELLVRLAGPVVEDDYALNFGSNAQLVGWSGPVHCDYAFAERMVMFPELRHAGESVEDALNRWTKRAGLTLYPYHELVEYLGWLLEERRFLPARSVAAIIREWNRRNEPDSELLSITDPAL